MIPSTRSRKIAAFESGAIAMLVALLLTVILRALINQPTLAETVGDRVVVLIPGNLFETGIQTLGPLAKRPLFVALSVAQVLVGGVLAIATDTSEITGQRSPMRSGKEFGWPTYSTKSACETACGKSSSMRPTDTPIAFRWRARWTLTLFWLTK